MEERNLRRYPFFRWMGCFGVDLEGPRAALPGVRYAVRLLRGHARRLAWVFVQGRLRPADRPVTAKSGALLLARRSGAQLLPLTIRYEWLEESRPSVLVRVGPPFVPDAGTTAETLAAGLNDLLAETGRTLESWDPAAAGYAPVLPPRVSMNRRWDRVVQVWRGGGEGS